MNSENKRVKGPNDLVAPEQYGSEQDPAGEDQGINKVFSANDVASAFEVAIDRVHNAFAGEFNLEPEAKVNSRQAQILAEVILGNRPQADQDAALLQLGAYTPRRDTLETSVSEKRPGELSDRLRPSEEAPEIGAPDEPGL
jgi:hypothetical protein